MLNHNTDNWPVMIVGMNVKKAFDFLQIWTVYGQRLSCMTCAFGKN